MRLLPGRSRSDQRRDRERGRRIAALRLEHCRPQPHADLAHLLGDDEAVVFAADEDGWPDLPLETCGAQRGLLEQSANADEWQ